MTRLRFGKHPPKIDYRTLRLKKYLTAALPAPPASYSSLQRVYSNLGVSDPAVLFPMDDNDQYGCCTIAALAHAITVYQGLIGNNEIMSAADVLKLYMQLTGGVDSGLNELDVLNYWQSNNVEGEEILAYVSADSKNHTHVQQALSMFGLLYIGFQVQENAISDFENGVTWTAGDLTNDGHAVIAIDYDQNGVKVLTWGGVQPADWSWWDCCVDEVYPILSSETTQFDPGFNICQLKKDLSLVSD